MHKKSRGITAPASRCCLRGLPEQSHERAALSCPLTWAVPLVLPLGVEVVLQESKLGASHAAFKEEDGRLWLGSLLYRSSVWTVIRSEVDSIVLIATWRCGAPIAIYSIDACCVRTPLRTRSHE